MFFADGSFKFKFGSKGTGNGQFDLPAGVGVDPQNRIGKQEKKSKFKKRFLCFFFAQLLSIRTIIAFKFSHALVIS